MNTRDFAIILEKLLVRYGSEDVAGDADLYWYVDSGEMFSMASQPEARLVGSLADDEEFLMQLLAPGRECTTVDLERAAHLLLALAEGMRGA